MGSVSDLQAEKLQLTYRKPAEVENSVECDDFESGGVCADSERCYSRNCYRMCVRDADCPRGTMCDLTMCRPIGEELPGDFILNGDVTSSSFDSISGDRLSIGGGRVDADFSNLELRQLSFSNLVHYSSLSDQITLSESRLETLFIQN